MPPSPEKRPPAPELGAPDAAPNKPPPLPLPPPLPPPLKSPLEPNEEEADAAEDARWPNRPPPELAAGEKAGEENKDDPLAAGADAPNMLLVVVVVDAVAGVPKRLGVVAVEPNRPVL